METAGCSAADFKMNLRFMKCARLMTSVKESLLKGTDKGGQGQWPGYLSLAPPFLPIPKQETKAGCQVPKRESEAELMVTCSKQIQLAGPSCWQRMFQLWVDRRKGKPSVLVSVSETVWACAKKLPKEPTAPSTGVRHVVTVTQSLQRWWWSPSNHTFVRLSHYLFQFSAITRWPTRTAVNFTRSFFHSVKEFQPISTGLDIFSKKSQTLI